LQPPQGFRPAFSSRQKSHQERSITLANSTSRLAVVRVFFWRAHSTHRPHRTTGRIRSPGRCRCRPTPGFPRRLRGGRHGLEIIGLLATPHLVQWAARIVPDILGELPQALERITKESKSVHRVNMLLWIDARECNNTQGRAALRWGWSASRGTRKHLWNNRCSAWLLG